MAAGLVVLTRPPRRQHHRHQHHVARARYQAAGYPVRGRAAAPRKIARWCDSTITQPAQIQRLQNAARARGVEVIVHSASRREETLPAIDAAAKAGAEALNFLASPLFGAAGGGHVQLIIDRVRELRIPSMHQWPEHGGRRRPDRLRRPLRARSFANERAWSPECCAAPNPPTFRSSSRPQFELVINLQDRQGDRPRDSRQPGAARRQGDRIAPPHSGHERRLGLKLPPRP